ncbi:HAD hydrolase-like protein [Phototrophicus methaneseepsis]|uniref:HAD hydrolase-like protein n=1 Tax=Phototrophicus methaneseepsis TaxID=2710758 RepID=A0A7S8E664_9CHLR|nr:HAD family hydrolase [Phototrophicus methaneseepsis]QPC81107.1 HAD hydrolase-like protein [Phototrophicus methaneseepsis]
MIKAILVDLDNTLIANPDHAFARAFLEHFQQYLQDTLGITNANALFKEAIHNWAAPTYWTETNQTRLAQLIADQGCVPLEAAVLELMRFYETILPVMATHVQPIVGAASALSSLLDFSLDIVIATNPFYPRVAIEQRMKLGQLPVDAPYAFVTSSEDMHYSKQNPAYYAEVVARVGVEPDEALVIGDHLENDILNAQKTGLHTLHIDGEQIPSFEEAIQRLTQSSDWRSHYSPHTIHPEMIIPQWHGNIAALFALLAKVEDHYWQQHPFDREWSILQILSHLLEAEKSTHRARLQQILAEDNPFIVAPPPPGPDIPIYSDDGYAIAEAFLAERKKTTELIQTLTAKDWERPAQHSIFSKTTLVEMAHFTAQHDRLHINQLCQTLGHCK